MRRPLGLSILAVVTLAAALATDAGNRPTPVAAQGSGQRIVLPLLSRDVLPDIYVESLDITRTGVLDAEFVYRIRNGGDDSADLSLFTLYAWFSMDNALDAADAAAGVVTFGVTLAPGAALEATAIAQHATADLAAYPHLIVRVDSGGAVVESNLANNTGAALRPPLDLVTNALLSWDEPNGRAIVTWGFRGDLYGLEDAGFRVESPGFPTLEVPAGTREAIIPFDPVTGDRPCVARIVPMIEDGGVWPAVDTNRLC